LVRGSDVTRRYGDMSNILVNRDYEANIRGFLMQQTLLLRVDRFLRG